MTRRLRTRLAVCCCLCLALGSPVPAAETVKVFILAGQSNMEGHGNVELTEAAVQRMKAEGTFERNKNGYLDYLAKQSSGREKYKHLLDEDGNWARRDDVSFFCASRNRPTRI